MKTLYEKYFVKNKYIFYGFIVICFSAFILVCHAIKIERIKTYDCVVSSNRLIMNEVLETCPDRLYVYNKKGEDVSKYMVCDMVYVDNMKTILYITPLLVTSSNDGLCSVDIVVEEVSLMEIITYSKPKYELGE